MKTLNRDEMIAQLELRKSQLTQKKEELYLQANRVENQIKATEYAILGFNGDSVADITKHSETRETSDVPRVKSVKAQYDPTGTWAEKITAALKGIGGKGYVTDIEEYILEQDPAMPKKDRKNLHRNITMHASRIKQRGDIKAQEAEAGKNLYFV